MKWFWSLKEEGTIFGKFRQRTPEDFHSISEGYFSVGWGRKNFCSCNCVSRFKNVFFRFVLRVFVLGSSTSSAFKMLNNLTKLLQVGFRIVDIKSYQNFSL